MLPLHRSRPSSERPVRHGRRLLAGAALAAMTVLGTPALAQAADDPLSDIPVVGSLPVGGGDTPAQPAPPALPLPLPLPGDSETPSLPAPGGVPAGAPDLPGALSAFPVCVQGAVTGIQVALTDLGGSLTDAFAGFSENSDSLEELLADPQGGLEAVISLDPAQLEELIASGQESVTMVVQAVVDGVQQIVQVVVDLAGCLAAAVPTSIPTPTTPAPAPTSEAPVPVAPASSVTPAPTAVQPVAYPGYAPTGGAPEDGGSSAPPALAGLGALAAAAGVTAHRARRRGRLG